MSFSYYIMKDISDSKIHLAYPTIEDAISHCPEGYSVFDSNKRCVYTKPIKEEYVEIINPESSSLMTIEHDKYKYIWEEYAGIYTEEALAGKTIEIPAGWHIRNGYILEPLPEQWNEHSRCCSHLFSNQFVI